MDKKKKILIIVIFIISILLISGVFIFKIQESNNIPVSYEWVKEKDSVVNQQRLYINNKNKKHIEGYIRVTYLKGNSVKEKIPKEGKVYVRSVVKEVKVINKR